MDIRITIPDDKKARVIDAMKNLFPIPLDENDDPKHTDDEWLIEVLKQFIKQNTARWTQKKAQDAVKYSVDDSVVS